MRSFRALGESSPNVSKHLEPAHNDLRSKLLVGEAIGDYFVEHLDPLDRIRLGLPDDGAVQRRVSGGVRWGHRALETPRDSLGLRTGYVLDHVAVRVKNLDSSIVVFVDDQANARP